MSEPAVVVQGLSKKYPLYDSPVARLKEALHPMRKKYHHDFWALQDVSLEIGKGDFFGIIGRNGSGKSTILKILAGVLMPTEGTVSVKGKISALLELGSGFDPELTGLDNLYLNGSIMGFSHSEMEARIGAVLSFADIGDFANQPVKTYSSGMFVRLAFALAINVEPDILIVDEALAVGDVFFRQKCHRRLQEFREMGVTIILVSHALQDVEQLCGRAMVLHGGKAVFTGNASAAVKHYYLLMQADRAEGAPVGRTAEAAPRGDGQPSGGIPCDDDNLFWPPAAVFPAPPRGQVTNGWARCTAIGLTDSSGRPSQNFQQGETALFFYEFELLREIEVPVGGVVIFNDKNVIVHGKSTLELGTEMPALVRKGNLLRFRQEVSLNIAAGEYTFQVGLAALGEADYRSRAALLHLELESRVLRLCHVPAAGSFSVSFRKRGTPVQLLHHGLCDLPGSCRVSVAGNREHRQQDACGGPEAPHTEKKA